MAETKKKTIADTMIELGVDPERIEGLLNLVHSPPGLANMSHGSVRDLFVISYPLSGEHIFEALYEANILRQSFGSGHGGSSSEMMTVHWESWNSAYRPKSSSSEADKD